LGGQTQAEEVQEVFNGSPELKKEKPSRGEGYFFLFSSIFILLL